MRLTGWLSPLNPVEFQSIAEKLNKAPRPVHGRPKKSVYVDGKKYPSVATALRELNISHATLQKKLYADQCRKGRK